MRGYTKSGLIMLLISWIICLLIDYVKSCALVDISSPNTTLLATEHSSVLFNITLLNKSCKPKDGTIHFKNNSAVKCIITVSNAACVEYNNPHCGCEYSIGPYWFRMDLTRFDNAKTWTWQGVGDLRFENSITFNITYPAEIKRLTVNDISQPEPHFLHLGQNVLITCSWENGNPPTRVRLLKSEKPLVTSVTSGNITYEITSIRCKDYGNIRCAAEDVGRILSALLIVMCPPDVFNSSSIVHNVSADHDIELHFPFCAHTPHITLCQLDLYSEILVKHLTLRCDENPGKGNIDSLERESCLFTVRGNPPDLHLVLRIFNVTNAYHGEWRLTLTNVFGSDNINFSLRIVNRIDYTTGDTLIIIHSAQYLYIGFGLTGSITLIFAIIIGVLAYRKVQSVDQSLSVKPTATIFQEHCRNPLNELHTDLSATTGSRQEKDVVTHELPQTTTNDASIGGESAVKFLLCKNTDIAQVFLVLREQQPGYVGRLSQPQITGSNYTPTGLPQYSTLDSAKLFLVHHTEQSVADNWDTPDKYLTPSSDRVSTLPRFYEVELDKETNDKISLDQGRCKVPETEECRNNEYYTID